jgi:hypothetical protein
MYDKGETTMKKTTKTMATAMILSSAVAMQAQLSKSAVYNEANAEAPLYGPPSVLFDKGDANWDGEINILDMISLKETVLKGKEYTSFDGAIYDINGDELINSEDLLLLQYYFTGITTYIGGGYAVQPTYGPVSAVPVTEISDPEYTETTTTTNPPVIQTVYGPPPGMN